MQMEQIIGLLERADAASSLEDQEKKYLKKRRSLGTQPLEALTSFYCPITKEVMVDPVETPSGLTFERVAIEERLTSEGNGPFCPITLEPLDVTLLRPNKTLRQSIEEWKERNTMIILGSLRSRLLSEVEGEVVRSLEQVEGLCEEREIHYIPCLVVLLRDKNREIRSRALRVLCLLAKHNVDAKEKVLNALERIFRLAEYKHKYGKLAQVPLVDLTHRGNRSLRSLAAKLLGQLHVLHYQSSYF